MVDFSWGDGGLTIYWGGGTQTTYPPGTYPPGYTPPYSVPQQTQISTGMLIVIGLLAYVLLTKN